MGRVFKHNTQQWRQLTVLDLHDLQEFPMDGQVQLESGELPPTSIVEQPAPDFEALRAEIIAEARGEAERMVQAAYAEGLQRGEAAGHKAFESRIAGCAEALDTLSVELFRRREDFLESLEPQVLALSKLIAERVLAREIKLDDQLIRDTVHRALGKITDRQKVTVHVNPEDLAIIREYQPDLLTEYPGIESFVLEGNDTIVRGGCVVESDLMRLDARVETLLAHVLEALVE